MGRAGGGVKVGGHMCSGQSRISRPVPLWVGGIELSQAHKEHAESPKSHAPGFLLEEFF